MSGFGGLDLFELFRGEVEVHGQALNAGLLALEAHPDDATPVTAIMRAAHSIKGAGRVVGLESVVSLAHAMEDALVRIQKGVERCTSGRVQQLLQGTDVLTSLQSVREPDVPAWNADHAAAINELITALSAPAPASAAAPAAPPVSTPAPEPATTLPVHQPESTPAAEPLSPAPSTPAQVRHAEPVSTEVRTVRVNADNLDRMMRLAGESMVEGRRFPQVQRGLRQIRAQLRALRASVDASGDPSAMNREVAALDRAVTGLAGMLESAFRRTEEVGERLYHEVIGSRMRPFGDATAGFPRLVRDVSRMLGRQVRFEMEGLQTPVDRDILARLDAPLNHILRNAIDHGVESPSDRRAAGKGETAMLRLEARHHAGMLEVRVRDDGRGIDPERIRAKVIERRLQSADVAEGLARAELLEFLFLPGFSTAGSVTEVSGRGVGLDVVHQTMRELGGSVRVESEPGRGTTFVLSLPITLSVIRAALMQVSGERLAFPLARIDRIERIASADLRRTEGRLAFDLDGESIGVLHGSSLLELPGDPPAGTHASILVIGGEAGRTGILVDGFLGERDLVVRPLDARLGRVPHVAASALDEDGVPLLVMDVEDMLVSIRRGLAEGRIRGMAATAFTRGGPVRRRILIAEDSITVREVERQMLLRAGYHVEVAVDGVDAWNQLCAGAFDMLVTDLDMPRMNGIELVRALRRDPRFERLPVAIVSYKDRPEDREAGLHAGANAYLTKGSFQDRTFLDTIIDLVGEPVP
ncbi:MAG: hybrid sensor histidine kinase/response regulator [Planctomycetes bacterium]|nr:hybrid sensor histidine kinase/response regulator [Planctomycetota bacterium]